MGTCARSWLARCGNRRLLEAWASHLCQTREIDQSQVEDVRGVDLEVDGLSVDAFVVTGDSGRLVLNLALYITKVVESSVGDMVKLCPFGATGSAG